MSLADLDLNVKLNVDVCVISEAADGTICKIGYGFGVARMPTREDVDKAIVHCIAQANQVLNVDDCRLTTLRDFGFASEPKLEWQVAAESEPS